MRVSIEFPDGKAYVAPAQLSEGVVMWCQVRELVEPCSRHWFFQWFCSFSRSSPGARPGLGRGGRRGQGRAPGLARAPWQQPKGRERTNQFVRSLGLAAARALFCRVGSLLPQRPVPRQAAVTSLVFLGFFHASLRWCKACSGGARRHWRRTMGHSGAAAVSLISKNYRFWYIFTWTASYVIIQLLCK